MSATFAASLVTSPALGAYLGKVYSDNFVIWLATAIAVLDVLFILVMVPESLPDKLRTANWGSQISWEKADPLGVSSTECLFGLRCFTSFFHFQVSCLLDISAGNFKRVESCILQMLLP